MTNITIIGSGFAALAAARELRRRKVDADITMVSPRDQLHFLPSVIWLPPRLRSANALKVPLANFFAKHHINYVQGTVSSLKDGGRVVVTDRGELRNDHLIVACGARFMRDLPGLEHVLIPGDHVADDGLDTGEEIARRIEAMKGGTIAVGFAGNPEEPSAVRAAPMFELLFIIDKLLRRRGKRPGFQLAFFSPASRPGARLGDRVLDGLFAEMKKRGIVDLRGRKLLRFEDGKVVADGSEFDADLILFMPGLTGPKWLADSGLALSPGGMIRADELCSAEGASNVWVAGDVGSFPGPDWMSKQAHQAGLQALAVAANIDAIESGEEANTPFKPEMMCIVDALDAGTLVFRNEHFDFVLPNSRIAHWLKRAYERHYLTTYR